MSNVYVKRGLRKDIPEGAVILTRSDALIMQWNIIRDWPTRYQRWPFTLGVGSLGMCSGATAVSVGQYYRRKLKLGIHGRVSMMLPIVFLPTILSVFGHYYFVTSSVLLRDECPLCIQTRAAGLQVLLGVVFPVVSSPFAGFVYALNYGTCYIPPLKIKHAGEVFKLWLHMIRRLRSRVPIAIGVNAIVATAITYMEQNTFYSIQNELYKKNTSLREATIEEVPTK